MIRMLARNVALFYFDKQQHVFRKRHQLKLEGMRKLRKNGLPILIIIIILIVRIDKGTRRILVFLLLLLFCYPGYLQI